MSAEQVEAADVLDRMANPHPRMWGEARLAFHIRHDSPNALCFWEGYLAAMCAATGYERGYFEMKLLKEARSDPIVVQRGETPVTIRTALA